MEPDEKEIERRAEIWLTRPLPQKAPVSSHGSSTQPSSPVHPAVVRSLPPFAPSITTTSRRTTHTDSHRQCSTTNPAYVIRKPPNSRSLSFRHPRLRDPSLPPCLSLFPSNTRTDDEKSGHDGAGDPHVKDSRRGMTLPGIHGVVEWWASYCLASRDEGRALGRGSPLFSSYCLSKSHGAMPFRPFAAPLSPPRTACARAGPVCVVMVVA